MQELVLVTVVFFWENESAPNTAVYGCERDSVILKEC